MASLRRSNALSTDNQTAKFLYTILKQLDLKAIDWNQVAEGLDITNGHAARMRFSRFKQHMEGIPTQPRAARPKKDGIKDAKGGKAKAGKRNLDDGLGGGEMRSGPTEAGEAKIKPEAELRIKPDPGARIKHEAGSDTESSEIREPRAVRVKKEIRVDENSSLELFGNPTHMLPVPPQSRALSASFSFAPAPRSDPLAFSFMSAPVSTVSLADVELSPKSIPPALRFASPIPTIIPDSAGPSTTTNSAVHVKKEQDLGDVQMLEADALVLIKSEPKNS